ncbi:MAG: hypothetical protein EPN76_11555 [Burkholderiaceae bacterium]|nr:MAG: hypothetical protein EPN76_11555 [Burkholderiaceae bacterium]
MASFRFLRGCMIQAALPGEHTMTLPAEDTMKFVHADLSSGSIGCRFFVNFGLSDAISGVGAKAVHLWQ